MKNILLIACAAAAIVGGASIASADQYGTRTDAGSSLYVRVSDHYQDDWQNHSQDYDSYGGYGDNGYYGTNGYSGSNGYYGNNGGYAGNYGSGYSSSGGGNYGGGYSNGYSYGGGYGYGVMPPYAIVRYLYRSGFTYISQPVLSGQFYQLKARDPSGRKVKLYIDARSGQIARVKH